MEREIILTVQEMVQGSYYTVHAHMCDHTVDVAKSWCTKMLDGPITSVKFFTIASVKADLPCEAGPEFSSERQTV